MDDQAVRRGSVRLCFFATAHRKTLAFKTEVSNARAIGISRVTQFVASYTNRVI
ncbi:hypothetical protein RB12747 [Rhodopirellula baltica SH 1]|uniref:Uncharacterized protein n=1 Tax=Rhodopirellula baltica (strain DSM 10527 / NCIMB 13988 / SH1) TaxID=243090 RepID=Q7UI57_RHOBA|nr:hypothetical protein RB12747 [Rhodopirellula baltica SH 1]